MLQLVLKKVVLAIAGNCYIYVSNEFSTVGWYEMGMIVLARWSIFMGEFLVDGKVISHSLGKVL